MRIVYEGEKAHEMAGRIAEFFRYYTHHRQPPAYLPEVSASGPGMIVVSETGTPGISLADGVVYIRAPGEKLLNLTDEFLACLDKKYPFYSMFGSQNPTREWDFGRTGEQRRLIKGAEVTGKTQSVREAAREFCQWVREKKIDVKKGF